MEMLIKAAVVGGISALMVIIIKKSNPEMALLLSLAAGTIIIIYALRLIGRTREVIDSATRIAGLSPAVVTPVLKCVGIGVITRLCSDICNDADSKSIASSVELAGAAAALYIALPLLQTLLQMISGLL